MEENEKKISIVDQANKTRAKILELSLIDICSAAGKGLTGSGQDPDD